MSRSTTAPDRKTPPDEVREGTMLFAMREQFTSRNTAPAPAIRTKYSAERSAQ
jgi:hypothetical protein